MNRIARNLKHCGRCGESHDEIETKELERPFAPPEAAPIVWTHWAPCPTNGEPIMFIFDVEEKENSDAT